jgi:predicted RNA binding protein YcfA (HicA-like mRNA interferase family)
MQQPEGTVGVRLRIWVIRRKKYILQVWTLPLQTFSLCRIPGFEMKRPRASRIDAFRWFRQPPSVKVREAIKAVEKDGWYLDRTRGSHRQYKHPTKRGLVTIAGKPGDDLAPGTKNSILKQAGLK